MIDVLKIKNKIRTKMKCEMKMILVTLIFTLFITLFSQTAFALTPSPPMDLGELVPGIHEFTISITNDASAKNITLSITPRSRYLENYVIISPTYMSLSPYETKQINIRLNLPNDLPPGEHELIILPNIHATGGSGVSIISTSTITIKFRVPGMVSKQVTLNSFNVYQNGKIEFKLSAENKGNVRVSAVPYVEIRKYGNHLTLLKGTTQHLLYPSQLSQMQINYINGPGLYEAVAYVKFDGTDSNKITKTFTISQEQQQEQADGTGGGAAAGGGAVGDGADSLIWWDEEKTIDIGKEGEKKISAKEMEIKITDFNAVVKDNLSVKLKIENKGEPVGFVVSFRLVDENGNTVKTATEEGNVSGLIEIRREININDIMPGTYILKAELVYKDGKIEKSLEVIIPKKIKTPTGFVIAEPNYSIYAIFIVVVIIFIAVFVKIKYFNNRKKTSQQSLHELKKTVMGVHDEE